MNKSIIFYSKSFLFLTSLILISCGDDFLTTTLEIEPPAFEKKVVLNGVFNSDTTEYKMYVGTNQGILENEDNLLNQLQGASLSITNLTTDVKHDFEELMQFEEFNYKINTEPNFFKGGSNYEFVLNHPEVPESITVLQFPSQVEPYDIRFDLDAGITIEGDEASRIIFKIDDPIDEENQYNISVFHQSDLVSGGMSLRDKELFSPDLALSESVNYGNLLVDDDTFNGETKEIEIKFRRSNSNTSGPEIKEKYYVIIWRNMSTDAFLFDKTYNAYRDAQDNPFLTPVQVHNNVANGLGLISLGHKTYYKVNY